MAKVRARPESGSLYFDFQYQGVRCREYTTLDDSPANRRKVEAVLKKIEGEISLNTFDYARYFPNSPNARRFAAAAPGASAVVVVPPPPSTPLFKDFAATWVTEKEIEWRLSYRGTIKVILDLHLLPYFGDKPVGEIERGAILAFRAGLVTKPAPKKSAAKGKARKTATLNRIVGILRQILAEASVRHGFANPADGIKRLKTQREEVVPFSMEEVQKIVGSVRADYRDYLVIRFFTGIRSAEAHGLKWKHIDFDRGLMLIRETFFAGRTETTKTDGSQRDIQLSQPVLEALRRQRALHRGKDAEVAEHYVFATRHGRPIDNKNFNDRVWKPLLRLCGLPYRRPYQMRHTCATLWLAAGENPQWIARQLGHTTTEMLFRTYGRYVPNLLRRDGVAFDRLVSSSLLGGVAEQSVAPLPSGRRGRRNAAPEPIPPLPLSPALANLHEVIPQ